MGNTLRSFALGLTTGRSCQQSVSGLQEALIISFPGYVFSFHLRRSNGATADPPKLIADEFAHIVDTGNGIDNILRLEHRER